MSVSIRSINNTPTQYARRSRRGRTRPRKAERADVGHAVEAIENIVCLLAQLGALYHKMPLHEYAERYVYPDVTRAHGAETAANFRRVIEGATPARPSRPPIVVPPPSLDPELSAVLDLLTDLRRREPAMFSAVRRVCERHVAKAREEGGAR